MPIGRPYSAEDNCLELSDQLDAPIYRVFTKTRFLEMVAARQLALVRPRLWDDPFENFLYQVSCECIETGTPVSIDGLRERFYGQCWSLTPESDAMWRIYAPDKDGIKVRTTVRRLIKTIYNSADAHSSLKFFIGRVQYKDESDLLNRFAEPDRVLASITDTSGRAPVYWLLFKRREFEHENEVRLIFQCLEDKAEDVTFFPIDPFTLFDEIVVDSRMELMHYDSFIVDIKAKGFSGDVRRSKLYQLPLITNRIKI